MSISYADFPTVENVIDLMLQLGLDVRALTEERGFNLTDAVAARRAAVIQRILMDTHRQFVADTEDTVRHYDGSGTGLLEVDEMVSLTSVVVIGYVPAIPSIALANAVLQENAYGAKSRIIVYRSSLPGGVLGYMNAFPEGRNNIEVTGKFGYAATVPADLWEASQAEMAAQIAQRLTYNPDGRVSGWKAVETEVKYELAMPKELMDSERRLARAISRYQKPMFTRLRKLHAPMV